MNVNVSGTEWMSRKACDEADVDPEVFFPNGVTREANEQARFAKSICGRCLVKNECAAYAMENAIEFGVWGGLDEQERRRLLKGRPRVAGNGIVYAPCGSESAYRRHLRAGEVCDPCRDGARAARNERDARNALKDAS